MQHALGEDLYSLTWGAEGGGGEYHKVLQFIASPSSGHEEVLRPPYLERFMGREKMSLKYGNYTYYPI